MESVLLLAFLIFLPEFAIQAQEFRAVITGHVTDPSGAVIKDVTVTAVNIASGTSIRQDNCSRVYYIPYVLPGPTTV